MGKFGQMWPVRAKVRSRCVQLLAILLSLPSFSSPSISLSRRDTSTESELLLSHLWSTLSLHILNFHTSPTSHHPTHLPCRAINFVYDSTATLNHYPLPSPPTLPATNLILNLSQGGVVLKQEAKLHRPCSLLLLQVHPTSSASTEEGEAEEEIRMNHFASWSNFLGSPHHIFFLFLATAPHSTPSTLLDFSRKTRQIHHAVFALLDSSSFLRVFRRTTLMTRLVPLASYPLKTVDKMQEIGNFFRDQPTDFEGDVMAVKVCPICAPALDDFKATGVWTDYMIAAMWEVSLDFNATLEAESVFSLPGDGKNDDGEWDGFMQPLVDGSAVISAIIRPTFDNIKQVYISAAGTYFDSVSFVTALPTKIPYTSLLRLLHPFSPLLWLTILISILAIFTLLRVILQFRWEAQISRYLSKRRRISRKGKRMSEWELELVRRSTPMHAPIDTIIAILKPIVDQSGLTSKKFAASIIDGLSRFSIGMWFLLLITLGCAYKSKVIEMLVHPHFDEPPQTFAQLLDSDYDIGALFYVGIIKNDFDAVNNSLGRRLDSRVTEYPYHESTCYQRIFEGRRACLGFREIFQTVGAKFMTDVRKRQMFRCSTDAFFFVQATIAVSKFYPQVIQPFNWIMNRFVVTGLVNKIYERSRGRLRREGQEFALNSVDRSPAYSGSKWHEEEDDFGESMWQITHLLIQLIFLGAAGATVAFLSENTLQFYHLHFKTRTTPVKIFINELPHFY